MPKPIPEKQLFKIKLLRNTLIVFISIATALSIYNFFFIYPSFIQLVIDNTKNDAVRVAEHLSEMFMPEKGELGKESFIAGSQDEIEKLVNAFELNKLKIFSSTGKTVFSTDPDDIGKINKEKYFHEIVAKGHVYAAVKKKDSKSMDGQKLTADAVETYVPLMSGERFLGAFEIYYDITARKEKFDKLLSRSSAVLFTIVFGLLLAIGLIWIREKKTNAERRQAEILLRESEEKLAGILNSFTDLVIVVDRDLTITWSNHAAVDFFGTDPVGKKCHALFHSRNIPCTTCHIEKCFQDGRGVESEVEYTGASGVRLNLWYTAGVATRTEEGVPATVIVVYRDITEKKLLQAETARTGQLASIGELAAGVAHEINNPINGIINCAQLLIDQGDGGREQAEISKRIIKAGSRIAMIVRNLLSFARDRDDEPQSVTVQGILSDSLDLTETQIRKDDIDLRVDIPDEIPKVRARSHQLQQVFLNIISNARYALNRKAPAARQDKVIDIRSELVNSDNKQYVRLTFYDNGTGIPAEIFDKICDPFFSSKPRGEGTGLGLSISHAIIKDHGGKLNFDSVAGDYTKVIIDLPVAVEDNL
jgi:PAS domain S-box-containing protein